MYLAASILVIANRADAGTSEDFLSPDACAECHQSVYDDYLQTSHFKAMQAVEAGELDSQFTDEHEFFYVKADTANSAFYRLTATGEGYEQRIYLPREHGLEELKRLPLEIQLGSGKFAKAYVRWEGDRLFLNPLSFYAGPNEWAFGPGIFGHLNTMQGGRPVTAACLDCHSGHFDVKDPSAYRGPARPLDEYLHPADTFVIDRENVVLPISCVKCHGSGERHVRYHRQHPEAEEAQHIARIDELSQMQQVQICGFCHTPPGAVKRTPFSFQPGDTYADFIEPAVLDFKDTDPHATQAPYLTVSKCFESSPSMTCTTCHNPHRDERDELTLFSQRCMECHGVSASQHSCTEISLDDTAATANCIDCHMPRQTTSALPVVGQRGERLQLQMRNHWIKVHD